MIIQIGRKKLVNELKISFCAKSLVPEIYRAKVGNFASFLKKVARLILERGAWVRGTYFRQQQDFCIEQAKYCAIFI